MTQTLLLLGRQPALGMAEAESLFGATALHPIGKQGVIVDLSPDTLPFDRLGGSMRAAKVLTYIDTTDWDKLESYLLTELPKHTCCLPEGKIKLGLSTYGLRVTERRLNATGLALKKAVKQDGRSVRVVPNKSPELNTAQVIHNQLLSSTGMELILLRDGNRTLLAQTTRIQDIDAYAARDQARPARDARVGMLPPKLAQIIVNLANPPAGGTVLDPFCGTGVLLQEAALMGFATYGTDLEPRMIDYSQTNLTWLTERHALKYPQSDLAVGDATTYQWEKSIDAVACETYLGKPFSTAPPLKVLSPIMDEVDQIHRKFLQNVARQTKPGLRLCIAVPAWHTKSGVQHLKMLDSLEELGYNRISFVHAEAKDLIYHRDNQIVGRELVTLIRK